VSRIVLLPSAYLPSLGGVQELTRNLALSLAAAGDEVEIWAMRDDGDTRPRFEILDGLVVRRFPFALPNAKPSSFLPFARRAATSIRELRAAVRVFEPDILHVQCFGPNGVYATALSYMTGVPLMVTLQGETVMDDQDIYDHSAILRTALRIGLRRSACVSACSAFTLHDAEARFGLPRGRGHVVFNGVVVALPADKEPPEAGDLPGIDGRFVLALGRVVDKKGFDLLLQAFSEVASRHPDVDVAIGGDGPALSALRSLAVQLGIADRTRFLGRLSRSEVAVAMSAAELFVMPSRLEPFGIVVLEAWRAGRAVVATSYGGPPEFIDDGTTGMLVDPFDRSEFARVLDDLLTDSALRERISAAGQQRVDEFAWSRIAGQYREHYDAVLASHQ